jgi:hypothetical protein
MFRMPLVASMIKAAAVRHSCGNPISLKRDARPRIGGAVPEVSWADD